MNAVIMVARSKSAFGIMVLTSNEAIFEGLTLLGRTRAKSPRYCVYA